MSVGVRSFRGERLTEARLARGLFKNALGAMIGVSGTAIGRYEAGEDQPQWDRLTTLARQLSFPVEFFSKEPWPDTFSVVHWRSQASDTVSAREMTEQRMRWLCELFFVLESEAVFPDVSLPSVDLPSDFRLFTSEDIERAATTVRGAWGLRDQPIPDVALALENAGIPVATWEISSDKQDGFCFWSYQLSRPFVGINSYNVSRARARFDAAHELGHLILHRQVTRESVRNKSLHPIIEAQAHRFAGAFLFPRDPFIRHVRYPSLDYFSHLKTQWGMSIAAMVMRAFDLGMIAESHKQELFRGMTKRRWRGPLREPFDNLVDMPLEKPRMIRRAVELLIDSGTFAKASFVSSIALPSSELESLAGLEKGYFAAEVSGHEPRVGLRGHVDTVDLQTGNVIRFPKSPR